MFRFTKQKLEYQLWLEHVWALQWVYQENYSWMGYSDSDNACYWCLQYDCIEKWWPRRWITLYVAWPSWLVESPVLYLSKGIKKSVGELEWHELCSLNVRLLYSLQSQLNYYSCLFTSSVGSLPAYIRCRRPDNTAALFQYHWFINQLVLRVVILQIRNYHRAWESDLIFGFENSS